MSTQNRLNGLAMLAIEHELSYKLDLKEVILDFAGEKLRKILFSFRFRHCILLY